MALVSWKRRRAPVPVHVHAAAALMRLGAQDAKACVLISAAGGIGALAALLHAQTVAVRCVSGRR